MSDPSSQPQQDGESSPQPQAVDISGAPPTAPQRNGIALAGLILAVLCWPVGLALSIAGFAKSKRLGGTGRGPALAGMVIAPIVGAVAIASVTALNHWAADTRASAAGSAQSGTAQSTGPVIDPGCALMQAPLTDLGGNVTVDVTSSNYGGAMQVLHTLVTFTNQAEGKTQISAVTTALEGFESGLQNVIADVQNLQNGAGVSQQVESDLNTYEAELTTLQTACNS